MMKKIWRIWVKTLGNKISDDDRESDIAALIRTFWWFIHVVACIFIVVNNGKNLGLW